MDKKVVLVCGSRDYTNESYIHGFLDTVFKDEKTENIIVEGEAPGADSIARNYGEKKGYEVRKFPADWKTHGKAAGPIRNKQMLDENPDISLVVAFSNKPLEESRGTANMVKQASERKIAVIVDVLESVVS